MTTPTQESAKRLNEVLKGEISAIETYEQVLEKLSPSPEQRILRSFLNEHKDAKTQLEKNIEIRGEKANDSSGVWGSLTKAWVGTAKVFGDKTALKALKEGEEHGLKEYEEIVKDEDVSVIVRDMIQKHFIPNQKKHVETLEQYIKRAS